MDGQKGTTWNYTIKSLSCSHRYRLPQNKAINEALPFMNSFTNYTTPSGVIIERKPVVRDLGVRLSDDFTWRPHISNMVKDTRKMASWTLGVFRDRSKPVMLQLYKSLIRSRLEYCCPLQSLQRRRERYIIIHTWKIIMDIVPNDIGMKFVDNKRLGTRAVVPGPCFQQNLYHEGKNILRQLFRSQGCPTLEPPPSRSKDIPLVRQIQNITV